MAPTVGGAGGVPARTASSNQPRSVRNTTAIGVAFDGAAAGPSASARGRGARRSQATSPSWQRPSSQPGE